MEPERLLAPIAERCQLVFAGGNYRDHLAEAGLHPKEPVFFPKLYSAVIGPGEPISVAMTGIGELRNPVVAGWSDLR